MGSSIQPISISIPVYAPQTRSYLAIYPAGIVYVSGTCLNGITSSEVEATVMILPPLNPSSFCKSTGIFSEYTRTSFPMAQVSDLVFWKGTIG